MSEPSPVTRTDVSILVVGYNSTGLIEICLRSIPAACTRYRYEILLVDNGDGSTEELVRAKFPEVRIVPSLGNVGFAAGNNLLAKQAKSRKLLLLNPDVELKAAALDLLMDATITYPSSVAWGGVTLDQDDRPDLGNTVHVPSLGEMASRVFWRSNAARDLPLGPDCNAQVEVLSGSFVLFDREAWNEVGGLDERYFLYCEEVDLFYRLAKRGFSFWRIGAARANHYIGHGEAISATRMLYRAAGTMQFARLHWSSLSQNLAFLFLWLGAWQRLIVGRLIGWCIPHFKNVGESHRVLALRPALWRYGYDPAKGLLTRMKNRNV